MDELSFPVANEVEGVGVAVATEERKAALATRLWPVFLGQ